MQSGHSCPILMGTTTADLLGDCDQCSCEQSGTVCHTRGCGSVTQRGNPNFKGSCNLHTAATLSSLSMEDLQTSLQTVCHPWLTASCGHRTNCSSYLTGTVAQPQCSCIMYHTCLCLMQVNFENNYLAARVDMLRHQHKYTSQILASPLPAASPRHSKKRPPTTSAPPMAPESCETFRGFSASTSVTSALPNYPDFMELCIKQPVCASLEANIHKKCKQSKAHCQHHSLDPCATAMPYSMKQASTACLTNGHP